jgi:hypothetical protein
VWKKFSVISLQEPAMARAIRQGVVLVRLSGAATRTIIIMTGAEVEDTMTEEVNVIATTHRAPVPKARHDATAANH